MHKLNHVTQNLQHPGSIRSSSFFLRLKNSIRIHSQELVKSSQKQKENRPYLDNSLIFTPYNPSFEMALGIVNIHVQCTIHGNNNG